MIERPCRSSSLAREYTASAPSPFSCETRDAIRVMVSSGRESYHFARNGSALGRLSFQRGAAAGQGKPNMLAQSSLDVTISWADHSFSHLYATRRAFIRLTV